MFKSTIVRYLTLTAAVVTTSSVILSINANLQSQSQNQIQSSTLLQSNAKVEPKPENKADLSENNPDNRELDLSPPDAIAKRPNDSDMLSGKMLKQLNLTPEQLKKLKEVRDRDQAQMRELSQKVRQSHKELRDLMAGNESNDALRAKHNQVLSLQQELKKQHFERMLAMREILTPQQRSQLNELMQKKRDRMRDNMRDNFRNKMRENFRENMRDQST